MDRQERDYGLDVLKAAATILIVLHHYQQVYMLHFQRGINFYNGTFYFGYLVELFFVISGFVMHPYIERIRGGLDFRSFFAKRYIRIFPILAITVACFGLFLIAFEAKLHFPWNGTRVGLWGMIVAALGLQGGWVLPNPSVNNPSWYLSVLLVCYAIFYFCVWEAGRRRVNPHVLFFAVMLLGMGIITFGINLPFLNSTTARGYYAFFWGLLLAELLHCREPGTGLKLVCLMLVLGIPFLIAYANGFVADGINYLMTFVYYSALIVVVRTAAAKQVFRFRVFKTLASYSFNVYMWHSSLFILFEFYLCSFGWDITLGSRVTMACFVLFCYLVGAFSHYCLEKPLAKKAEAKLERLLSPAADSPEA